MKPAIRDAILSSKGIDSEVYARVCKDPAELIRMLDSADVEKAGLMSYQSPDVIGVNNEQVEFVSRYRRPYRDRLVQIGSANPVIDENPVKTLEWLYSKLEVGIVKIHPVHQLYKPNAYRREEGGLSSLQKMYEFLDDHEMPVMVHTGSSIFPGAGLKYGDPIFLDDVANDFPGLRLIMCHAGRPTWTGMASLLMRKHPKMMLDLTGIPPKRLLEYLPKLEEFQDRAIFGTDWASPGVKGIKENKDEFEGIGISAEAKRKILYENAKRIFG
ncbi:MAG: amidohydrolase [Nitrososphaerota archaeon]|nr:amidohydrolase [Nitrososphaerota archaeon]